MNLEKNKKKNIFSYFDIFASIILSYKIISDADKQNFEFIFRNQYYNSNFDKKDYQISKNFTNFFNKIIIKFTTNNNVNIKIPNANDIIKKIYTKNKDVLIENVSKIISDNNLALCDSTIFINGMRDFYHGMENIEILNHKNNLNKKRKRYLKLGVEKEKINVYQPKRPIKINNNNNSNKVKNVDKINVIDINESNDKSKKSFLENNCSIGDINEEYIQSFRKLKKYNLPKLSEEFNFK